MGIFSLVGNLSLNLLRLFGSLLLILLILGIIMLVFKVVGEYTRNHNDQVIGISIILGVVMGFIVEEPSITVLIGGLVIGGILGGFLVTIANSVVFRRRKFENFTKDKK